MSQEILSEWMDLFIAKDGLHANCFQYSVWLSSEIIWNINIRYEDKTWSSESYLLSQREVKQKQLNNNL